MENLFFSCALAEGETAPGAISQPNWFQTVFEKFGEISTTTWIAFGVILLVGIALFVISRQRTKWTPKLLAYAALSIALAFILSYIRLWKMPQGGSITPASMLPLMLFSYVFGVGPGLIAGAAYGILQFVQDSWMLNIWQFLLDYPIAFGLMALAGIFGKKENKKGLYVGIFLASFGRFAASTLSGVVFFAEYAPQGVNPLWYSMGYNGSYMLPEMVICLIVAFLAAPRLVRLLKK